MAVRCKLANQQFFKCFYAPHTPKPQKSRVQHPRTRYTSCPMATPPSTSYPLVSTGRSSQLSSSGVLIPCNAALELEPLVFSSHKSLHAFALFSLNTFVPSAPACRPSPHRTAPHLTAAEKEGPVRDVPSTRQGVDVPSQALQWH